MTFSLTVLGSSAAIPANDRNLSAHLLNVNERLFLIDCGEGTQFQLRKYHISVHRIRGVFISHLHGDHFFGLIGLMNSMHLLRRKELLDIYAPAELEEIIRMQLDVSQTVMNYPWQFHPLDTDRYSLIADDPLMTVHSFPLYHRIPACGFVFREKNPPRKVPVARSFAYCSDTAYAESYLPYLKNVMLLYHEATFSHDLRHVAAEKFHSTAVEAATAALKAGAGSLVIGHFSARYEDPELLLREAQSVFAETSLAVEGKVISLH